MRQRYVHHDSFATNDVRFLMSLLSSNLLHAGAELLGRTTRENLGRERFRALLLNTTARVLLGNRKVSVLINSVRARLWTSFWQQMERMYPARASPPLQALPTVA